MARLRILAILALSAVTGFPEASFAAGDAAHGEKLYQACKGCHVPGKNTIGPMHDGVYGSKAGIISGYSYSPALKNSDVVWNDETLDPWLTNPQAFIPGSKMFYKVGIAKERADIIEYLKSQATKK